MLYRALNLSLSFALLGPAIGQITVDVPLIMTGDDADRVVVGVAPPATENAGLSVEAAALGLAHWATAVLVEDTIVLELDPPGTTVDQGLLVRFVMPGPSNGALFVRLANNPPRAVLNGDGLPAFGSELPANSIAELVATTEVWQLQGTGISTCPSGTLPIHASTCIDIFPRTGLTFYQGAVDCAQRGGRLCSWDEYIAACIRQGTALTGLFDDWEWMNATANHTHTVGQAGRTTCTSQRSAGPNLTGATRCCYRTR
jgi:hypothetical protein